MANSIARLMTISAATMLGAGVLVASAPVGAAEPAACDGRTPTITVTEGNTTVEGTDGADVILVDGSYPGLTVRGNGGGDRICGGARDEILVGGPGDDRLLGNQGQDSLYTGSGHNLARGGPGDDAVVVAKARGDRAWGGADADYLQLRSSRRIRLNLGADSGPLSHLSGFEEYHVTAPGGRVIGTQGNDVIVSRSGSDLVVRGRGGSDRVVASLAYGGEGNDRVNARVRAEGGRGDDKVWSRTLAYGGKGNDQVGGTKRLYGGPGDDDVTEKLTSQLVVGGPGDDELLGGRRVMGGPGADTLIGEPGEDGAPLRVDGGRGNDRLVQFVYNPGTGRLDGGLGRDRTVLRASYGGRVDLRAGTERIELEAGSSDPQDLFTATLDGVEDVYGSSVDDVLRGDGRDNVLVGHGGNDTADGRGGVDTCKAETVSNCEG